MLARSSHSAWIKLHLLVHGIEVDESVPVAISRTSQAVALRKNFYNTPGRQHSGSPLPQELNMLGLVVGLNSYGETPWRLRWLASEDSLVLEHTSAGVQVRPNLIPDLTLFHRHPTATGVANLYGGAALAFFSPRNCYFFTDKTECGFCSLAGTAKESDGFKTVLAEDDIRVTIRRSLDTDPGRIEQIMIVGGNMRDLDKGFNHHLALAIAAREEVEKAGVADSISIHIATMPPRDLRLLQPLSDFGNIHVMFNLEVWDPGSFAEVCPGKDQDYGRLAMLRALERLRDTIGAYRAHSLLVTGLESAETTITGARALAEMGISPIINIYHSDQHSRFGLGGRPKFSQVSAIASDLHALYQQFPVLPYWRNCGRNSIDSEAERGLFRDPVPPFLEEAVA